ncbi:amidohydrolase family protein [Temperatibacter marinus]|uniref:Amidohydrolase family protein n=1 Tax=Temperatibacter marinus TaxID=1456591 RepID=A0AA52EFL3_9PROT|nr:amidohydrolase family protein [Temperatibacter marinus]WND01424.1 amidohydrolase family protein [Temperatibacter marinus]
MKKQLTFGKRMGRFALKPVMAVALALGAGQVTAVQAGDKGAWKSTYKPMASKTTFITNVNVYDGKGGEQLNVNVGLRNGKIFYVGSGKGPAVAYDVTIDGKDRWLTPGIIDVHSHLGVYPSPSTGSHSDGNEIGEPVTADVWAEHGIWPQDAGFAAAAAGGITALQILPGSANLIGGRTVTLKNVYGRMHQDMKFPGAPHGVKFACGENPKRVYGRGNNPVSKRPYTRMGNIAGFRQAFADATHYKAEWDQYEADTKAGKNVPAPARDLKMDTLKSIIEGDILVHNHCYRADDMGSMLDVAKEFGFKIGTFHHAVESYKIADRLKEAGTCSAMWADWGMFKMEAFDSIRENIPFVHKAGACAIVHSDDDLGIQRLNQEAAKSLADAHKVGVKITKAEAWTWLSLNPAKSLGIDKVTGTLETGKNADVVLWSKNPFSVYAVADMTFVDGAVTWDINDKSKQPIADFELGTVGEESSK